jgi:hypothetical protein
MKTKLLKTLNKFNDNESGVIEVLALLGFIYFVASIIVRA